MEPWKEVLVWGLFGLIFLFGVPTWCVQGRMLRRERARERELRILRLRIEALSPLAPDAPAVGGREGVGDDR